MKDVDFAARKDHTFLEQPSAASPANLSTTSQLDRNDYTVGWICATPVELAVSQCARSTLIIRLNLHNGFFP
jgi:hypothetical protein